jgi:hypothetical protein
MRSIGTRVIVSLMVLPKQIGTVVVPVGRSYQRVDMISRPLVAPEVLRQLALTERQQALEHVRQGSRRNAEGPGCRLGLAGIADAPSRLLPPSL